MVYNATLYDYGKVFKSCTLYVVLLIIALIIIMGISGAYFIFVVLKKRLCWYIVLLIKRVSIKDAVLQED